MTRQVQRLLTEHLRRHGLEYTLTPVEIEQLIALGQAETGSSRSAGGEETGHNAVILSRERFMPSAGVMVEES